MSTRRRPKQSARSPSSQGRRMRSSFSLVRRCGDVVQSCALAHQAQDDAFLEIQLNGNQLVFLFMVATVVSVVIFLCGVFVGRGVRAERAPLLADATASAPVTTPDTRPPTEPASAPAGTDPTAAAPPPPADEL